MTKNELAKRVIESINDTSFNCLVYASSGAKCDDGWGDTLELELSKEEILFLLKKEIQHYELFDGYELKEVDLDNIISDMAYEAAWPDGKPSARVNNPIPNELQYLSEEIANMDLNDTSVVQSFKDKLKTIIDGDYTFEFTVEAGGYYFTEDAQEKLGLTSEQAIGLLYGENPDVNIFKEFGIQPLDSDFIDELADSAGFASDYDYLSYDGRCESLEACLNAWKYIIEHIFTEVINEESLDVWMQYFEDNENFEYDIAEWYEGLA